MPDAIPDYKRDYSLSGSIVGYFDKDSCHHVLANQLVDEDELSVRAKGHLVLDFADEQMIWRFQVRWTPKFGQVAKRESRS